MGFQCFAFLVGAPNSRLAVFLMKKIEAERCKYRFFEHMASLSGARQINVHSNGCSLACRGKSRRYLRRRDAGC